MFVEQPRLHRVVLLRFTKVESQLNPIPKRFLRKRNAITLVSEFAILAQKWLTIVALKKLSLQLIIDESRSRSAATS